MKLPEPDTFANRVKRARILKGLTQQGVAKKIFVALTTVANWEAGIAEPYPGNLAALAKTLDVSIEWLLKGDCAEKPA